MATIYFSGAISGGRDDVHLYVTIVERLRDAGHEVLAGEVVNPGVTNEGESLGAKAIYDRDLGWLAETADKSGVVVAEVSRPSLGVGYEIAAARYRFGLPVIALWRPGHAARCSAMVGGDANVTLIEYREAELESLGQRLERAISERLTCNTSE